MMETEPWAQLVSTNDVESEPILITKDIFTIGRSAGCDVSLTANKLVSNKHCTIEKDNDQYWITDASTNGTLLNLKVKIPKGKRHKLTHGDEIHVVYKKEQDKIAVGYLFQVTSELKIEETEATQEFNTEDDGTLIDEISIDDSSGISIKRKVDQVDDYVTGSAKKKKVPTETDSDTTHSQPVSSQEPSTSKKTNDMSGHPAQTEQRVKDDDEMMESMSCVICQEILYDCISLQPCMHSFCSGCYSDWMKSSSECPTCRMKVDRINKNHIVNNLVEAFLKAHPDKKRSEEDLKDLDARNTITKDMLYPKNISSYDEDSFEGSDEDQDEEQDSPPRIVNFNPSLGSLGHGLATPYGVIRPQITTCRQCPSYVVGPTTVQSNPPGLLNVINNIFHCFTGTRVQSTTANISTTTETTTNSAITTPAASDETSVAVSASTASNTVMASTSSSTVHDDDRKTMPVTPQYVCIASQNHLLCSCCLQPMPDRRHELEIPRQNCSICYRAFCHAYWGCQKSDCLGCLGKINDITLGRKCLTNLILDNTHESNILRDFLQNKNISVRQLQQECLDKLMSGAYTCPDGSRIRSCPDIYICYPCSLKNFKELAYQYRQDIPASDLPDSVTSRPSCYWGRNCRTQKNRPPHAQKYNHICHQTRTT